MVESIPINGKSYPCEPLYADGRGLVIIGTLNDSGSIVPCDYINDIMATSGEKDLRNLIHKYIYIVCSNRVIAPEHINFYSSMDSTQPLPYHQDRNTNGYIPTVLELHSPSGDKPRITKTSTARPEDVLQATRYQLLKRIPSIPKKQILPLLRLLLNHTKTSNTEEILEIFAELRKFLMTALRSKDEWEPFFDDIDEYLDARNLLFAPPYSASETHLIAHDITLHRRALIDPQQSKKRENGLLLKRFR